MEALIHGGAYFRNFTVFVIGCGYTPKIIFYLQGKINCSTITKNYTNNLLQHSLLILRKKKNVLQSTKRWNQRGTNVVILSEAFCAQTNLFWCEMKIL